MLTIEDSDIFREEYNKFQTGINSITAHALKVELSNLLSKLLYEVRMIDSLHVATDMGAQIQETIPGHRSRITELRTQLDRRIRDWQQRQPQSN